MMAKLAAAILTYGDWLGLQRTIAGLWGCDIIFVVHAKFRNNPVEIPESREMTEDAITLSQFRNYNIKMEDMSGCTEYECRSAFLEFCKQYDCDYMLIIDSDEYIFEPTVWNWAMFRFNMQHVAECTFEKEHNVFGVWCTRGFTGETNDWEYYPRLWYKPDEMMYKFGSHFRFVNKKDREHYYDDYATPAMKIIEGIKFIHSHDLRLGKMNLARSQYHEWLKEEEAKIGREILNASIEKLKQIQSPRLV
jgi:hypothetical protein